jgi:hypothetical protein
MAYYIKNKKVEILEGGPTFSKVKLAGDEDHKSFDAPNNTIVDRTDPPVKVGKQRNRNYALFVSVYSLLKQTPAKAWNYLEISSHLDPDNLNPSTVHSVSAVLSAITTSS